MSADDIEQTNGQLDPERRQVDHSYRWWVRNPREMTGGRANNSYDGGSRLTTRGTEDYLTGMRGLADDGKLDA